MQYLLKRWDVDISSFAETQVDWRHTGKEHQFDGLFALGSDKRIVIVLNFTVRKILSPRNQRGGTVMVTFGRVVTRVCEVNRDETKLRILCLTKLGVWKDHICDDNLHATRQNQRGR